MQSSPWMGKGYSRPKKHGWVGQRWRWCWLCFRLERHCPSWICTTWSDGKQTVVSGSFRAFERCCAQEEAWIVGKPNLDVAPRTMRRLTRRSSSAIIWQIIRHLLCPIHPILHTYLQQTVSCFPNLKPLWKDVVCNICVFCAAYCKVYICCFSQPNMICLV